MAQLIRFLWRRLRRGRRRANLADNPAATVFRRGRALVGDGASRGGQVANSTAAGRLSSLRLKLHHLRAKRRAILGALLATLLVAGGLVWLIGQFIPQSVGVTLEYQSGLLSRPDTARYADSLNAYFALNPTERFMFNVNQPNMQAWLIQQNSEIKTAKLERTSSKGSVRLVVALRDPVVVWRLGGEQLYIDASGVVFKNNYFAQPALTVNDQSGITAKDPTAITSGRFLGFLGQLVANLNHAGVGAVNEVIIPAGVTREVDIRLQGRSYVIKAYSGRDAYSQAADIISAVRYLDAHKLNPQYVDVRVAGKAFYK
ncbi:MAG: hypothetical protein EOT04_01545 [Candidatus Chaera renei]|uniref:Cell division protein FtsQ n=1 Tax=Candidatus Chaera renei TaxID=2506947 RepID=A0A4Q0AJ99_9BACT|nr:MAG: hypothetical protein EOT04_01545 [Candidatus Chaera renei]